MLIKVISGGQTGADQGGLAGAKKAGIETGGWMPKGCRTEIGTSTHLKRRYGLRETKSIAYPPRTRLNAEKGDGTLWIGRTNSAGWVLTSKWCEFYNRPFQEILFPGPTGVLIIEDPAVEILKWLDLYGIEVLNVAGNRESTNPGIFEFTKKLVYEVCCISTEPE